MASSNIGSTIKEWLQPPSGSTARRVEHAVAIYAAYRVLKAAYNAGPSGMKRAFMGVFLKAARATPGLAGAVKKEEDDLFQEIETDFLGIVPDPAAHVALPSQGSRREDIVSECTALRAKETAYHDNKAHAGIYYHGGDELATLQKEVYGMYLSSNILYPGVFKSVRKYEAEIVSMVVNMVNGGPVGAVGCLASGGTEAVLLAVKAHREWALKEKGIDQPEIVAGITAHSCLDKACHYLKIKLIKVPVDKDQRLRASSLRSAMTKNTIMIYGSAPTFPHGVVDPIEELSELALEKKVGLHVDNCLGGFLLSHLKLIGEFNRSFDFELPGVTSMSVDVHKFGCACKGASVVAYRTPELRRYQYYGTTDWSGGLYATPTMQGSRSGAVIAGTWATMIYIGQEGYKAAAKRYADGTRKMVAQLNSMPNLRVITTPDAATIGITSDVFNIYHLADRVSKRGGWVLQSLQNPPGIVIQLGERILSVMDDLLADIRAECEYLTANPSEPATGAMVGMYGSNAMLPREEMIASLNKFMDLLYKVKPATA